MRFGHGGKRSKSVHNNNNNISCRTKSEKSIFYNDGQYCSVEVLREKVILMLSGFRSFRAGKPFVYIYIYILIIIHSVYFPLSFSVAELGGQCSGYGHCRSGSTCDQTAGGICSK